MDEEVAAALPLVEEAYTFLHEHPELGKQETQAQQYLTSTLQALGYTQFEPSPSAPKAVIAVLETGRSGPVVSLRAEIDARRSKPARTSPRIIGRDH